MDPLSTASLAFIGLLISLAEERLGTFEKLSPRGKQIANLVLSFAVPALVAATSPGWRAEFGNAAEFFTYGLLLVVPFAITWASTQLTHLGELVVKKKLLGK